MTALPQIAFAEKYAAAVLLAKNGVGWEDIRHKLQLPRTDETRQWLRAMVLKRRDAK